MSEKPERYDATKHDVAAFRLPLLTLDERVLNYAGHVVDAKTLHGLVELPIIVPRQQYLVPGTFAWAFVEMEHHRCDRYTWGAGTLEYYITRDGLLRTVDSEWPCKWELIDIFVPLMSATDWRPVETQAKEPAPQLTLDIRALKEKLAELNAIVGGQA